MNKIRLFKIKSFIILILLLSSQFNVATASISINRITLEQAIKEKTISINVKNQSVKSILYEIQKQSGISFAIKDQEYADNLSDLTLQVKNMSVDKALDILLSKTDFTYLIVGDAVTVVKRSAQQQDAKKFIIKGKVIDGSTKRPIPGATVLVVGTTLGAITDEHGTYSFTISVGQTIEVSYVGMKTYTKKMESEMKELNITLQIDQMDLDNVIITGQSNISKNSFTGNAKTISGENLLKVSRTNILKGLQAFDPSFRLAENIQFGSDPNALPEMTLRGRSSLGTLELDTDAMSKNNLSNNPNRPTFILDGFEVSMQKVYDLDPNRIQSVTILKDAAATAMYGSRAANGVIVITTVPISGEKVLVSYNLTTTLEIPDLSDYNLMNAKEVLQAELDGGAYTPKGEFDAYSYWKKWNLVHVEGVNTDWMSQPLRNAFKHNHSLTVDGGSGNVRYGVSMKYSEDNGVMRNSSRNNTGADVYIQGNFGGLNIKNSTSFGSYWTNESNYGTFSDYTHKLPYSRFKDEHGQYPPEVIDGVGQGDALLNPLFESTLPNINKTNNEEFSNNLDIRWNLNDYFRITGQISYTKTWDKGVEFYDPSSMKSTYTTVNNFLLAGDLYDRSSSSSRVNGRFGLSYNRNIGKNNVNFTLNGELSQSKTNSDNIHYVGFAAGIKPTINNANKIEDRPKSTESTARTAGVTGIFNYSYDNIYLADLSLRYEGSSMFGDNQKGAPFWSMGLGVNIHNYEFMRDITTISRLKVRGSYGQVGNVGFPPYAAQNYYVTMFDDWYPTGFGTKIEYLGNPDLRIETSHNLDVGIDMGLFNDRVTIVASYYNKTTIDMINDVTIPTSSGFSVYKDNFGRVRNQGYELEFFATLVQKKDLNIVVNANLASNKNTLLEIGNSLKNYNERVNDHFGEYSEIVSEKQFSKPFRKYEEGGSLTSLFGMRSLGINPMTGREVFVDRNGDVVYDWSAAQQTILGNTEPTAQGSLGLNVRYKNFSLYASFSYEFGGQRYNQTLVDNVENVRIGVTNLDKRVSTDRWKKPGDVAPLKNIADHSTTRPTSRFVQDYNVFSFNSLSLQYEFSDKIAKKMYMQRLRIELSSNELFRLSSVKQERGLSYPFARSFNLSLMVNF